MAYTFVVDTTGPSANTSSNGTNRMGISAVVTTETTTVILELDGV